MNPEYEKVSDSLRALVDDFAQREEALHVLITEGPSGKFDIFTNLSPRRVIETLRVAADAIEGGHMLVEDHRTP